MPTMGIPGGLGSESNRSGIKMANPLGNEQKVEREVIDKLNGTSAKSEVYKSRYKKDLDKDEFLKMLTFQLQNQDPMKPMDQMQMTGELAQLSQLEQMTQMKEMMMKQDQGKFLETRFYGAGLLGKKVYSRGDTLHFAGEGTDSKIRFQLAQPAEVVVVRLVDKKGNIVFQKSLENVGTGHRELKWEGETLDGGVAQKGSYQIAVSAYDESKNAIPVETQMSGVVNGIEYKNSDVILSVDGQPVDLRTVERLETIEPSVPTRSEEIVKNLVNTPNIIKQGEQNNPIE